MSFGFVLRPRCCWVDLPLAVTGMVALIRNFQIRLIAKACAAN